MAQAEFFQTFFVGSFKTTFFSVISETFSFCIKDQTVPAKATRDKDGSISSCFETSFFEKLWKTSLNVSIPMFFTDTELN